jgi:hypothetical protein
VDVDVQLTDLQTMHPRLEWGEMLSAAAIVLGNQRSPPFLFPVEIVDVPGCDLSELRLRIGMEGIDAKHLARLRRSYEPPRFVETAAVALAGLALYHAGEHELMSVVNEGAVGDFFVDERHDIIEIAGRSRRRDFEYAFKQRQRRLLDALGGGFFLFVAEFHPPRGLLSFRP